MESIVLEGGGCATERDVVSEEPSGTGSLRVSRFSATSLHSESRGWHRHAYFQIGWINEGTAAYLNDFGSYPVPAGTVVFTSMGQFHQWHFSAGAAGYRLDFSSADLCEVHGRPASEAHLPFFFGPNSCAAVEVPRTDWSRFDRAFEALLAELDSSDPLRFDAARALLRLVLIRCQRLCQNNGQPSMGESARTRLARRFWWELHTDFRRQRLVQEYAARLQVTANHLVETVREQFGRTPGELIDERLYAEARRLLFHTTRSVSEVAYLLEFKSPSHFGAFFKRHARCSPGEARKEFCERTSSARRMVGAQSIKHDKEVAERNTPKERALLFNQLLASPAPK